MNARAVSFDLVGTLVSVRGGVGEQYAGHARAFGIVADAAAIEAAFPEVLALTPAPPTAGLPPAAAARAEREMWRGIVRRVFARAGALAGVADSAFDACFDALFTFFATAGGWEVYPDVRPALDRLAAAGLRLALVTNFDSRVFPLLADLGLARSFDLVAIPAVAGAAKPDARIFRFALDRLRVEPTEAIHVGDSICEDAEAAGRAGLTGVWLDRTGRDAPPPGVRRIATLSELVPRT